MRQLIGRLGVVHHAQVSFVDNGANIVIKLIGVPCVRIFLHDVLRSEEKKKKIKKFRDTATITRREITHRHGRLADFELPDSLSIGDGHAVRVGPIDAKVNNHVVDLADGIWMGVKDTGDRGGQGGLRCISPVDIFREKEPFCGVIIWVGLGIGSRKGIHGIRLWWGFSRCRWDRKTNRSRSGRAEGCSQGAWGRWLAGLFQDLLHYLLMYLF